MSGEQSDAEFIAEGAQVLERLWPDEGVGHDRFRESLERIIRLRKLIRDFVGEHTEEGLREIEDCPAKVECLRIFEEESRS